MDSGIHGNRRALAKNKMVNSFFQEQPKDDVTVDSWLHQKTRIAPVTSDLKLGGAKL